MEILSPEPSDNPPEVLNGASFLDPGHVEPQDDLFGGNLVSHSQHEYTPLSVNGIKFISSHTANEYGQNSPPSAWSRTKALPLKKLETVLKYIDENLHLKIGTEKLATLAQLSQYHFSRAFKVSTGLSPHQYVIKQRVERAKQLLCQDVMSITDVALACGFTHQSHLNRHFKRLCHMTPRQFLNQECTGC